MAQENLIVHAESPANFFKKGFNEIARTRMAGLPIVRPDIHVETLGFTKETGQWLGVVVTPWSLLVVLACADKATWESIPVGAVHAVKLPAGEFSFLGMNDPILGEYQACSLMSPLTQVPDQKTADAIALTSLKMMLNEKLPELPQEKGTPLKKVIAIHPDEDRPKAREAQDEPAVNRRDFFTRYWK